jgi:hypothetical protein
MDNKLLLHLFCYTAVHSDALKLQIIVKINQAYERMTFSVQGKIKRRIWKF